jgi:hypothetical protein
LLTIRCDSVDRTFIEENILPEFFERVFQSPYPVVINRFAAIAQRIYLSDPERIGDRTVFVHRFLPFLHHRSVFGMFAALLAREEPAPAFQRVLAAENFVDHLLLRFDEPDTDPDHIVQLFRLIPLVHDSPALAAAVEAPAAFSVLLREPPNSQTVVLNAQWKAIAAVVTDATLPLLRAQLDRVLNLITRPSEAISEYHIAALELVQKLFAIEDSIRAIAAVLPARLAEILKEFAGHTIAQGAITNLVIGALGIRDVGPRMFMAVLPIVTDAITTGAQIELRGFAWNFLKTFREVDIEKARLLIDKDVWRPFKELDRRAATPYGGEPPAAEPATGGPPNAQMLALLMQLLQGSRGR